MEQPLVSFIILTYNQELYVEDALKGALSQDYPNIEIIISDDNSTDKTPFIIEKCITENRGKQMLVYTSNEENLGLVGNLNKALSLSHGEYIILAAGDDISLPNRTRVSLQKIIEYDVDCLAMNFQYIDSQGNNLSKMGYEGKEEQLLYNLSNYVQGKAIFPMGPARIVRSRLFKDFNILQNDCQTDDTTITLRALLCKGVALTNQVGVLYRWHDNNISSYDSLMTKINPVKIYNQYRHDLETAYKKLYISKKQYFQVKRIILDYKYVQIFLRKLYYNKSRFKKHILGLLFILNPYVLKQHKTKAWLRGECPELFIVKNVIKKMIRQ